MKQMLKNICVFCSSSNDLPEVYLQAARELGELVAFQKRKLIFGGAKVGLMGVIATAAQSKGGKVVGVIPHFMKELERHYEACDELIFVSDMSERKNEMIRRSDAFVVLPGGLGTLDETFEVLTLNQIGVIKKPVYFMNIAGFYDDLAAFLQNLEQSPFWAKSIKPSGPQEFYKLIDSVASLEEIL